MTSPKTTKRPASTRKNSLYRLRTPEGTYLDLRTLIRESHMKREQYAFQPFHHGGIDGLLVTGTVAHGPAGWCGMVKSLTGIEVDEENRSAAGLLLVRTQQAVYTLTYGMGHHLIDPFRLDWDFGLEFATRCLDEDGILLVRRQIMDSRGRTDENATTRGERIADFGIERVGAIVTKISGTVSKIPLTYLSSGTRRTVRVVSSDSSIKLPIASTPDELLSDLHAIEDVCARPDPIPELGFIDRIRALRGKTEIVTTLEAKLEELLADPDSPRLAIGVPSECLDDYPTTETFQISKSTRTVHVQDLELSDLLHYVHERPAGSRLSALKDVRVQMFSDVACDVPVSGRISGHRWLTAEVTHSGGRYFYSQGRWYEIGVEYLASIEEELNELFSRAASVALPPWPRHFVGKDAEARYNEMAAEQDGYTLFDKKTIVTPKFRGGGLEICDILGPQNQLICVKQSKDKTAPLNHLFAQGTVAVEALRNDRQVREKFLAALPGNDTGDAPVKDELGALTLVYAILLKDGVTISVGSLFAFAQVSLLQAVHRLRAMNARVEIVTIRRC